MIDAGQFSYVFAETGTFVSATGNTESVNAGGDITLNVVDPSVRGPAAASATGDVITNFYSSGPLRLGYITITNGTGNVGASASPSSNATVIVRDFPYMYTFGIYCDLETTCGVLPTTTLPFVLGVSFSVEEIFSVSASQSNTDTGADVYSAAEAFISFSLSDANGNPVATNIVPEPTSLALWGLASLPLGVCMINAKGAAARRQVRRNSVEDANKSSGSHP
jgi:hypothetical protein